MVNVYKIFFFIWCLTIDCLYFEIYIDCLISWRNFPFLVFFHHFLLKNYIKISLLNDENSLLRNINHFLLNYLIFFCSVTNYFLSNNQSFSAERWSIFCTIINHLLNDDPFSVEILTIFLFNNDPFSVQ